MPSGIQKQHLSPGLAGRSSVHHTRWPSQPICGITPQFLGARSKSLCNSQTASLQNSERFRASQSQGVTGSFSQRAEMVKYRVSGKCFGCLKFFLSSFSCLPPSFLPFSLFFPSFSFYPSSYFSPFLFIFTRISQHRAYSRSASLSSLQTLSPTFSDNACKHMVVVISFAQLQCPRLLTSTPDTK